MEERTNHRFRALSIALAIAAVVLMLPGLAGPDSVMLAVSMLGAEPVVPAPEAT